MKPVALQNPTVFYQAVVPPALSPSIPPRMLAKLPAEARPFSDSFIILGGLRRTTQSQYVVYIMVGPFSRLFRGQLH